MPHQRRGPKEWKPGMRPDVVRDPASDPREPVDFHLSFVRTITSLDEVPDNADFRTNIELALKLGHTVEHWTFEEWRGWKRRRRKAGDLLWWPKYRRAGIVHWAEDDADLMAAWTTADNPLDALSRWVYGEMED